MTVIKKTPVGVLDYAFNWSQWLPAGDAIIDADVAVPDGLTIHTAPVIDGPRVVVWLAGGDLNNSYSVTCTITTAAGRVDARSFLLPVQNR